MGQERGHGQGSSVVQGGGSEAGKKWVHGVNSLCELTVESAGAGVVDRLISGVLMKRC